MTPINQIMEVINWIKGAGGSKMTQKNRTSFRHDPFKLLKFKFRNLRC